MLFSVMEMSGPVFWTLAMYCMFSWKAWWYWHHHSRWEKLVWGDKDSSVELAVVSDYSLQVKCMRVLNHTSPLISTLFKWYQVCKPGRNYYRNLFTKESLLSANSINLGTLRNVHYKLITISICIFINVHIFQNVHSFLRYSLTRIC